MSRWRMLCIALLCLIIPGTSLAQSDAEDARSFYLGFTPFPYEITVEGVLNVYDRIRQEADLIVHHFDNGVPWTSSKCTISFLCAGSSSIHFPNTRCTICSPICIHSVE